MGRYDLVPALISIKGIVPAPKTLIRIKNPARS